MIYEFCAENVTNLEKAMQAGARRIELCDNLAVGGTTPSYGVIKAAVELAKPYNVTVMTMIRPRGGDFVYNDVEMEIMLEDIQMARSAGTHGLVFGVLATANKIDYPKMEKLLKVSQGLEVVFHMAFDAIPREHQFSTIDWLIEHGVSRILTHGGVATEPIQNHFLWLNTLIKYAAGRIEILPGGGITVDNRDEIIANLGVNQLHGTKIVF
ncbi:copper homeostasis protein CutC [Streptococcus anginosus]|uniref:PF03932 family protein CutC n=1 Tax=Streptococcus anginosus SK1138 TaxID=1161422 RepID=A0AAD2T7I9_STRAP|nr:copper homeostasis protein CutC [Streptococcus anginosus]EJP25068.1 CutC family protein [Streptococcus anginosus SK1138]MCY7223246.1 copper homeostasis protein CutC [Streptococcus anginosus]RIB36904.1 copper homeostasis protein CutC [Streptococcus anginosus]